MTSSGCAPPAPAAPATARRTGRRRRPGRPARSSGTGGRRPPRPAAACRSRTSGVVRSRPATTAPDSRPTTRRGGTGYRRETHGQAPHAGDDAGAPARRTAVRSGGSTKAWAELAGTGPARAAGPAPGSAPARPQVGVGTAARPARARSKPEPVGQVERRCGPAPGRSPAGPGRGWAPARAAAGCRRPTPRPARPAARARRCPRRPRAAWRRCPMRGGADAGQQPRPAAGRRSSARRPARPAPPISSRSSVLHVRLRAPRRTVPYPDAVGSRPPSTAGSDGSSSCSSTAAPVRAATSATCTRRPSVRLAANSRTAPRSVSTRCPVCSSTAGGQRPRAGRLHLHPARPGRVAGLVERVHVDAQQVDRRGGGRARAGRRPGSPDGQHLGVRCRPAAPRCGRSGPRRPRGPAARAGAAAAAARRPRPRPPPRIGAGHRADAGGRAVRPARPGPAPAPRRPAPAPGARRPARCRAAARAGRRSARPRPGRRPAGRRCSPALSTRPAPTGQALR